MAATKNLGVFAAAVFMAVACVRISSSFVSLPGVQNVAASTRPSLRGSILRTSPSAGNPSGTQPQGSLLYMVIAIGALVAASRLRGVCKGPSVRNLVPRACNMQYGQDLSVPGDSFVALGLAHCFEQVDGKLNDIWVLEPISASTVEVIKNGAQTSYETFVGTCVADVLASDTNKFPAALLCGHAGEEVRFGDNLEFRTGCAARTWMRDHAREVVREMVPVGEVVTGFNTGVADKRILNFVNEVSDSDNIKQDMSIDVYGRSESEDKESEESDAIASLYNA